GSVWGMISMCLPSFSNLWSSWSVGCGAELLPSPGSMSGVVEVELVVVDQSPRSRGRGRGRDVGLVGLFWGWGRGMGRTFQLMPMAERKSFSPHCRATGIGRVLSVCHALFISNSLKNV